MTIFSRLRERLSRATSAATPTSAAGAAAGHMSSGMRVRGHPASSNKASSMHLQWLMPANAAQAGPIVEVSATLEVVVPPQVEALYFWALQASFVDTAGIGHGGAHLGLQWHPDHPGNKAANWGGYHHGGGELSGTQSPLPSSRNNPNTRNFHWDPNRPYRLTIRRTGGGMWAGFVDTMELRRLEVAGTQLANMMVWSEVFARCDDPSVTVRWSKFEARTEDGTVLRPERARVNYQSHNQGGCDNTTAHPSGAGILQVTNAARDVPVDTIIAVESPG